MQSNIPGPPKQFGQVLKELECVTEDQIQEALTVQRTEGGMIGEVLVKLGYISREEIILGLAVQRGETDPSNLP